MLKKVFGEAVGQYHRYVMHAGYLLAREHARNGRFDQAYAAAEAAIRARKASDDRQEAELKTAILALNSGTSGSTSFNAVHVGMLMAERQRMRRWEEDSTVLAMLQFLQSMGLQRALLAESPVARSQTAVMLTGQQVTDLVRGALRDVVLSSPATPRPENPVPDTQQWPILAVQILSALPPLLPSVGVSFLPATATAADVEAHVWSNRPFVLAKGHLDPWRAKDWTPAGLMARYANLRVQVSVRAEPKYKDRGEGQGSSSSPVPDDGGRQQQWQGPDTGQATKANEQFPVDEMTLGEFISTVMLPATPSVWRGNATHPDIRCVFNTFGKGLEPGVDAATDHPMYLDVQPFPSILTAATDPGEGRPLSGAMHGDHARSEADKGSFEWFLGPALSGTHPHLHGSAWNGLVAGRKRWALFPPETFERYQLAAGRSYSTEPPAYVFFRDKLLKLPRGEVWEFTQEEGEIVYVPHG